MIEYKQVTLSISRVIAQQKKSFDTDDHKPTVSRFNS